MPVTTERITIDSDGIELVGAISVPDGQGPHPAVVLCHGMPAARPTPTADITLSAPTDDGLTYAEIAELCAHRGLAAVIFNFRGTGESGGNFHPLGWAQDLEAMLSWVWERPEVDIDRIGVLGSSMGARVAIHVAARRPEVAAVLSFASPARSRWSRSPEEMVQNAREVGIIRDPDFPPSAQRWADEYQEMDVTQSVGRVAPRPLLLMHGDADDVVSPDDAHALLEASDQSVTELMMLPGAGHRFRSNVEAVDIAVNWLVKTLSA